MKKTLLFIPLLIFAFEPTLVKVHDKIDDPFAISSSNGAYRGYFEYSEGNTEFVPISRFVLKDANGNTVYEKPSFGHTLIDISNTGTVVGIDFDGPVSGKGILHFYDHAGNKINAYNIDFLLERAFSENGEVYCVNDGKNGLVVFNDNGEKLYDLAKTYFFTVSDDGGMIAIVRDGSIDIYEQGQLIRQILIASPFIRHMVFSGDGSQIIYMDKKYLVLFDISAGKIIFQYQEPNKYLSFTSCDISQDRTLVIAGFDEDKGRNMPDRHTHGSVVIFNTKGDVVWSRDVSYSRWNTSIPHVIFTQDRSFTIETMDDVFRYTF